MKALVLTSGGVDSSTALALAVDKYSAENVLALSVFYGQKHDKEIRAAEAVSEYYNVQQIFLNLAKIFEYSDSVLLRHSSGSISEGSYSSQLNIDDRNEIMRKKSESSDNGGADEDNGTLVSTYVPFRNGLFLSSAASIAQSRGCSVIYYGAHADDASGAAYPDCTPEFNNAINNAIWLGTGKKLKVEAPFLRMNKSDVVKLGKKLNVPYELTWSCYEGGDNPCGKCATCIDRAEAFAANAMKDPALKG